MEKEYISQLLDVDDVDWFHLTNGCSQKILAKVLSVHDGDTVRVAMCPFFRPELGLVKTDIRVDGIDTPELQKAETKAWAIIVRDYVKSLIENKLVYITVGCGGKQNKNEEKYANRVLGCIYVIPEKDQREIVELLKKKDVELKHIRAAVFPEEQEKEKEKEKEFQSLADILIDKGYAKPYFGKTKDPWIFFPFQPKVTGLVQRELVLATDSLISDQ